MIRDKTYLLKQNEALFNATLDEFSSHTYQNASTNQIIKNSDYNKGSFYYRFETKEDIYFALIDDLYTTQISLFNHHGFKLSNIDCMEDLVQVIFDHVNEVYSLDKRYFNLLRRIHRESAQMSQNISQYCIESLFERFRNRIKDIYLYDDIDFIMDTLFTHVLYRFNYEDFKNYKSNKERFIRFLLNRSSSSLGMVDTNHIDLIHFKSRFNYVLSNPLELSFNKAYCLSSQLIDKSKMQSEIKQKLKIKQISLTNVINSGVKKNLIDLSYLLPLQALNFSDVSYHKLTYIQKIILILVYNTVVGKEYQVINHLLSNVSYRELKLLFNQILPKIAKISTIVIVDDFIEANLVNDFDLFINHHQKMTRLKQDKLHQKTTKIEVNYYEDEYLKTKDFNSYNKSFMHFIQNQNISSVFNKSRRTFKDMIDYKE